MPAVTPKSGNKIKRALCVHATGNNYVFSLSGDGQYGAFFPITDALIFFIHSGSPRLKSLAQHSIVNSGKLLLSSLAPWAALLPRNSAGGGVLVKNTKTTGMTTRFVVSFIMVSYINLFVQLKQVKRQLKNGNTMWIQHPILCWNTKAAWPQMNRLKTAIIIYTATPAADSWKT